MVYWINAKGERERNRTGEEVPEGTLAIYENGVGERVSYHYAPEDSDAKYEVRLNDELVEDVTLTGDAYDEEEFDQLRFGTRADARKAASDLMRMLPPIDKELLVEPVEADEDEDVEAVEGYSYDELQERARPRGIKANQSAEELRDALRAV